MTDAPGFDGIRVGFGKEVNVVLGAAKKIDHSWQFSNVAYSFNPQFDMTLSYFADKNNEMYNSLAVGADYKGFKDVAITAEYGQNRGDTAKLINNGGTPYSWFMKTKYKGANPKKPGTKGVWLLYKKAQPGFDLMAFSNLYAPLNYTSPSPGGIADDLKGFEYGFEWAAFKDGVLSIR